MIDKDSLLKDLRKQVSLLEKDIDKSLREFPEREAALKARFQQAVQAGRTASSNYTDWRYERCTQAAVAWVLTSTFVRYLEDNLLIANAKITGPESRASEATDSLRHFNKIRPDDDDHHYLLAVFEEIAELPGAARLFDRAHNPLWELPISGFAAADLLRFWKGINAETGALIHDFRPAEADDPESLLFRDFHDTRFLGDLYQELSEDIRKRYALLQTPEFVESFILDYSLEPAIKTFGYPGLRLIDPTCGSGHFLLGAFRRLLKQRLDHEPARNIRVLVQETLDSVYGVDLNPYAVAIARFRLIIEALRSCHISSLDQAPGFRINVTTGDSLLHGKHFEGWYGKEQMLFSEYDPLANHFYEVEDQIELDRILGQQYHVVVGNPPYITVKDAALRDAYRKRYLSAFKKYNVSVPFTERFYDLALDSKENKSGFVGLICSNAFMKREFGKVLIESFFKFVTLTHVIDTSGAYIPGHGTPTVILFGSKDKTDVKATKVHTLSCLKGEPSTPNEPENGLVWTSIKETAWKKEGNDYVSFNTVCMADLLKHPWSIADEITEQLNQILNQGSCTLSELAKSIGFMCITAADEIFLNENDFCQRRGMEKIFLRTYISGENVRDWMCDQNHTVVFPYSVKNALVNIGENEGLLRALWPFKTTLGNRHVFGGQTYFENGRKWFEFHQFPVDRLVSPLSIGFAFVATHNHFVLDRGGKIFNRSAPVIKLPEGSSEEDHLVLLGLLNSSTACFWMKQVFHNKGATSDVGVLQADPEKFRFEFDSTKLKNFPIPKLSSDQREKLIQLSRFLDLVGNQLSCFSFGDWLNEQLACGTDINQELGKLLESREQNRKKMVAAQEELDWLCYEIYQLLPETHSAKSLIHTLNVEQFSPLDPDNRPYRQVQIEQPTFPSPLEKLRFSVLTQLPLIELIEKPEYKRRWFRSAGAYDSDNLTDGVLFNRELKNWLWRALEAHPFWSEHTFILSSHLADLLWSDARFRQVVHLYRGRDDERLDLVIEELMAAEAVPLQVACRYQGKGLDNHAAWVATWDKQRREDSIQARCSLAKDDPLYLSPEAAKAEIAEVVGPIPVPPKYKQADYRGAQTWRLRGPLDVPKERFLLFEHATRDGEKASLFGWAGWDHSQRAKAIATYYIEVSERQGWKGQQTLPILAALHELLPWLQQYHAAFDPQYGTSLATFYQEFLTHECRVQSLTLEDLALWRPPEKNRKPRASRARS